MNNNLLHKRHIPEAQCDYRESVTLSTKIISTSSWFRMCNV